MPSLSSILKAEITRLARKEIKAAVDPLRKANAAYRRDIAALKRQVNELQRENARQAKSKPAASEEPAKTARFSAKGFKSLRGKLGLSGADFGRLIGASVQSVYNWEAGKATPRAAQLAAIANIRGIGKREAAARLAALDAR